jgi:hypothetical protein
MPNTKQSAAQANEDMNRRVFRGPGARNRTFEPDTRKAIDGATFPGEGLLSLWYLIRDAEAGRRIYDPAGFEAAIALPSTFPIQDSGLDRAEQLRIIGGGPRKRGLLTGAPISSLTDRQKPFARAAIALAWKESAAVRRERNRASAMQRIERKQANGKHAF